MSVNTTFNDDEIIRKKKRFLKRYRKNQELIERLESKVDDYDDRLTKMRTAKFSDMPRGGAPGTTVEDLLDKKKETKERIDKLKIKGKIFRREILSKIDDLDSARHADILEAFCIDCMSFNDIAEEKGYSERHVIALYSEAIKRIDISLE